MKPKTFMVIAGETSGDLLAAELVRAIREEFAAAPPVFTPDLQPLVTSLEPRFFGAGGPKMQEAGVELAFDMTRHAVVGISDVFRNLFKFRRLFLDLLRLALERQPDVILCIDFSGFNRRLAHAVRSRTPRRTDWFHPWRPMVVQVVSPQVWASRESRVYQMAKDYDLVLSIFPFEKAWYARRVPQLPVEFVGHPVFDRYPGLMAAAGGTSPARPSRVLLLPGSRRSEIHRHLPVMVEAWGLMRAKHPDLVGRIVLPNRDLADLATSLIAKAGVQIQVGGLADALRQADVAMASTGTVTVECAYFGIPTVALYKTSWSTYQVAKRLVTVRFMAMPNLLADEELFPEFIQDAATPGNLAKAALELLDDAPRRARIQGRLREVVQSLGKPGASGRAARAILDKLGQGK
jgi:lipid-A-disaccharide synthase